MSSFLLKLGEAAFAIWRARTPTLEHELELLCTSLMQSEAALLELQRTLPSDAFGEAIGQCEVGSLSLLIGIPTLCADAGRRILELATFSLELEIGPIPVRGGRVDQAAWRTGQPLFGFKSAIRSFFNHFPKADSATHGYNAVIDTYGKCCQFVHCNPTIWNYARNGVCFSATHGETAAARILFIQCVRHAVYMVIATNPEIVIESADDLFGSEWEDVKLRLGIA